ncbi:MAG: PaaI family thioesterase [Deltaproteobacteria bacterium]|nr:PaaI family thioesterase [Deltaproteobacteria bacterium]
MHLTVEKDGEHGVKAQFIAVEKYRGWSNFLHGGVISLIFDELLGWTTRHAGYDAMTARLEIRYRNPVPLGTTVNFKAELERNVKGLLDIRLTARMEDGPVVAEGKGRMMIIKRRQ